MKKYIACWDCKIAAPGNTKLYGFPYNDKGVYEFECPFGHKNLVCLVDLKFEALFEIGADAVIDGYFRESVSSFASSLERYYEFFVSVVYEHSNKSGEFTPVWKHVSNQSERQLGAYILLYPLYFNAEPKILPPKWVKFRNKVIHKGYIPSEVEAMEFGEVVYRLVADSLADLRATMNPSILKIIGNSLNKTRESLDTENITTTSGVTILSLAMEPNHHFTKKFSMHLQNLKQRRQMDETRV